MLQSMRLQRVGHDWATELNWTCWVHEVAKSWTWLSNWTELNWTCCSPWGSKELDMTGWLNNNMIPFQCLPISGPLESMVAKPCFQPVTEILKVRTRNKGQGAYTLETNHGPGLDPSIFFSFPILFIHMSLMLFPSRVRTLWEAGNSTKRMETWHRLSELDTDC